VIAPDVGGGFGVKIEVYPEDVLVAALARLYQAPVRWVETRLENMQTTTQGRAQVADVEAAVQQDGTVTALRMRVLADMGCYAPATWLAELTGGCRRRLSHSGVGLRATAVFTNTVSIAAYRGAARPEAAYYIERLMDMVAPNWGWIR
jgi:carbon-monoxide dehydrogenase large subunit